MAYACESQLAVTLKNILPCLLQEHPWRILELAKELAREFDCPLCEILTPMGEALAELTAAHSIKFDAVEKSLMLA